MEKYCTAGQMTILRMRVACWIPKATNTHSEHVILIAFPLQQWLNERALTLRNTYIGRLVTSGTVRTIFKYNSFVITYKYFPVRKCNHPAIGSTPHDSKNL